MFTQSFLVSVISLVIFASTSQSYHLLPLSPYLPPFLQTHTHAHNTSTHGYTHTHSPALNSSLVHSLAVKTPFAVLWAVHLLWWFCSWRMMTLTWKFHCGIFIQVIQIFIWQVFFLYIHCLQSILGTQKYGSSPPEVYSPSKWLRAHYILEPTRM